MSCWVEMVREFQSRFEDSGDWRTGGGFERDRLLKLRRRLVDEECGEFDCAMSHLRNLLGRCPTGRGEEAFVLWAERVKAARAEVLDAICDGIYVFIGTALKLNMDLEGAFREVHRSNMSKLFRDGTVHRDEGGKVMKGEDFSAPSLGRFCGVNGVSCANSLFCDEAAGCVHAEVTDADAEV